MTSARSYPSLLIVCCVVLLGGLSAPAGSAWKESDYIRFTPQSFSAWAPAQQVIDPAAIDHQLLSAAIFYAANAERVKNGRTAFVHSPALRDCAFEHSRDMAQGKFFSHENPRDAAKRTPWQRMAAKGITGGHRAENIAMRQAQSLTYVSAASSLVQQWMNSKGHRANILNRKFKFAGCGAYPGTGGGLTLLATQTFSDTVPGSPATAAPAKP